MLCQAQSITLYLILRHSVAPLLYPPFLWGVIRHLASAVTTGDIWDVSDFPSWLDCGLLRCMCMCVKVTNGIWGNQVIKVIWGLTVSNISGLLKHLIERQLEVLIKGLIDCKSTIPSSEDLNNTKHSAFCYIWWTTVEVCKKWKRN